MDGPILFVLVGPPIVICLVFVLYACIEAGRRHLPIRPVWLTLTAMITQVACAVPVGYATALLYGALHPDDWYEIGDFTAGVGAAVATTIFAPFVGLVVVVVSSTLEHRRQERRPHHCLKCGYDLTGNVSGRCPECGTKTRAKVQ
ncbi:MAG: hypothetical protein PVJ57_02775 [Phycisphaerae bacterium]|jgi:hypothetical protein